MLAPRRLQRPAELGCGPERGILCPVDLYGLRGTVSSGGPSLSAGNRDVAKLLSFKPSLFVFLIFFIFLGGRDGQLSRYGERRKRVVSWTLREAVRIKRIHFLLCPLLLPKSHVGVNQVHSIQISEKRMGCDFSVLFSCVMQEYVPSSIQICFYINMREENS